MRVVVDPAEIGFATPVCTASYSTMLDQTLRNMGVESLIVSGVTTDVCVETTARDAADRGFQVIIVEDACTAFSEDLHRAALQAFSLAFGRVRKTQEVVRLLAEVNSL